MIYFLAAINERYSFIGCFFMRHNVLICMHLRARPAE